MRADMKYVCEWIGRLKGETLARLACTLFAGDEGTAYPWLAIALAQVMASDRAPISACLELERRLGLAAYEAEVVGWYASRVLAVLGRTAARRNGAAQLERARRDGTQLGMLTLARGRPLPSHVDVEDILRQAVAKGTLFVAVAFVGALLGTCRSSRTYGPRHPWVVALRSLLVELLGMRTLRPSLRRRIAALCTDPGVAPRKQRATRAPSASDTCPRLALHVNDSVRTDSRSDEEGCALLSARAAGAAVMASTAANSRALERARRDAAARVRARARARARSAPPA